MLEQTYQRYLSRLLLTFSAICESDSEIAQCMAYMKISPPLNASSWNGKLARSLIPTAYSTVSASSEYAASQTTQSVDAYCQAVYRYITKGN